ncbi:MAG: hypothetical protein ACON5H_06215 [Akkermansiaceae bacterium]
MKPEPSTEPEEDFWDLGDDDLEPSNDSQPTQDELSADPTDESKAQLEQGAGSVEQKDFNHEEAPAGDIENREASPKPPSSKTRKETLEDTGDENPVSPKQTLDAVKEKNSSTVTEISIVEKASLVAVVALLIGAAVWGISTFYDQAPEGTLVEYDEDFPLKGAHINVDTIETYWREPIRKGEDLDLGVQLSARLIPCARIKLSGNGNAALALSFRDSDKELIGDPFSLEVINGRFTQNNSHEITVNCTAGFTDISDINPYANGDFKPWSILIVEGESGTTPAHLDNEKKLAAVRIEPRSVSNESK